MLTAQAMFAALIRVIDIGSMGNVCIEETFTYYAGITYSILASGKESKMKLCK